MTLRAATPIGIAEAPIAAVPEQSRGDESAAERNAEEEAAAVGRKNPQRNQDDGRSHDRRDPDASDGAPERSLRQHPFEERRRSLPARDHNAIARQDREKEEEEQVDERHEEEHDEPPAKPRVAQSLERENHTDRNERNRDGDQCRVEVAIRNAQVPEPREVARIDAIRDRPGRPEPPGHHPIDPVLQPDEDDARDPIGTLELTRFGGRFSVRDSIRVPGRGAGRSPAPLSIR